MALGLLKQALLCALSSNMIEPNECMYRQNPPRFVPRKVLPLLLVLMGLIIDERKTIQSRIKVPAVRTSSAQSRILQVTLVCHKEDGASATQNSLGHQHRKAKFEAGKHQPTAQFASKFQLAWAIPNATRPNERRWKAEPVHLTLSHQAPGPCQAGHHLRGIFVF